MNALSTEEKLIILIEECGEVIQAATKCLRFGPNGNHKDYGNNSIRLAAEIGDLLGMIDSLDLSADIIQEKRTRKLQRAIDKKEQYGFV